MDNPSEKDILAIALSQLLGANVVSKSDYDKVYKEKEILLKKIDNTEAANKQIVRLACRLIGFLGYHRKWKPTTRKIEARLKKLQKEKLYVDFEGYPEDIRENLKEAYNCYINGLHMACYIMVLRTIEITANLIYDQSNPITYDSKDKPNFVPASTKLLWIKQQKIIGGADYRVAKSFIEARNDAIHEIYIPTEKQILSGFEMVIILTEKLLSNPLVTI